MSADIRGENEAEVEEVLLDRDDGTKELDLRETVQVLFRDPAVRSFTFTALGALGMIFLVLLNQASDIGGLIIVVLGVCGLVLRWSASPALVILVLTYFMIFPFGVPWDAYSRSFEIEEGHFRITDVMLVLSLLVYLVCHYRIYGFVSQAVPFEGATWQKGEKPLRRPAAIIPAAELGIAIGACAAFVFVGQVIWWLATSVEVVPGDDFPLRWPESDRFFGGEIAPGRLSAGMTRFVVLAGLLFFGTILGRLVFGYWRLRTMGPAEGGMILLDSGWTETTRERQRQETWRIWGRKREEARSQADKTDQRRRAP